MRQISLLAREARERGLSYGQYVCGQEFGSHKERVMTNDARKHKAYENMRKFADLYNAGATDYEMTMQLGLAMTTVRTRRQQLALPPNRVTAPPPFLVTVAECPGNIKGYVINVTDNATVQMEA